MDELYTRIGTVTKLILYQYMKDNNISLLNYNFNAFFQDCVQKYQIQVISHHFSNHKIEGLTVIDELGISFSCEKNNPIEKQNFTLCHELGHFILKHKGNYFTESIDNQENIVEREANIFSASILMPEIVLLSKIYYSCDSFYKVKTSLGVSKQALYFRLFDLFRVYFPQKEGQIKQAVDLYMGKQNAFILLLFQDIKKEIIDEFNQYHPSLENQIRDFINKKGFVSSQELPELLNQDNWNHLKVNIENIKIWLVYNKGKKIAYAWDSSKLSDEQARKQAELQLLLM